MQKEYRIFDLRNFYLVAITLFMAMSFFMSESKITLLIGYASVLVGIVAILMYPQRQKDVSKHIFVFCFLYILFVIGYVMVSPDSLSIPTTKGRLIKTILIYIEFSLASIILWRVICKHNIDNVFYVLTIISVIFSLKTYSLMTVLLGLKGVRRLGGEVCGINSFGMYFAILSLFFFYKIIDSKNHKYINILFWFVTLVFAATSGSRKALLGSILGAIMLGLLSSNKGKLKTILKIILICGLVFYLLSFWGVADGIFGRILLSNDSASESDLIRKNMARYAIEGWKERPIFGMGFNAFIEKSYFGTYAHNNYVELLFDLGTIGALLYYLPKVYILSQALFLFRNVKKDILLNLWIVIMVILLVFDFACVSYYDILLNFFWWIASAYVIRKNCAFKQDRINGI